MTDDEFEISKEPPRDDAGHPVHPEKGYPICGATKSERSTPAPHGRSRDDVDYCLQRAGWGTDREEGPCRNHPITGEQWGQSNPNFKTGKTSEYFKSKLSERQADVYDEVAEAIEDGESAKEAIRHIATRMILVGEHSHDPAMVREGRQLLSEFNIVDNTDSVEMSAQVDVEASVDHDLDEETQEVLDQLTGGE